MVVDPCVSPLKWRQGEYSAIQIYISQRMSMAK